MTAVNTATGEVTELLTILDKRRLMHAEVTIKNGLESFLEVGEALADVRDSRLYREAFKTFEAYCAERWGITDRRARQMIDASEVTRSLPTGTVVPVRESQARELVGLEPEVAAEVMQHVATTTAKPTASIIREARERIAPRVDHVALADAAIAEFPDLGYYRDEVSDLEHCWRLAETLRGFDEDERATRLDTFRKYIDVDRAKRNGTYRPTQLAPVAEAMCPTCGQTVKD